MWYMLFINVFILSICGNANTLDTLLGIDENNNSIRDDVEQEIISRYPKNKNSQLALFQLAKSIQKAFKVVSINNKNVEIFKDMNQAVDCISITTANPYGDINYVEMLMTNTDERFNMYQRINTLASGKFFGGDSTLENACQR